MTDNENLQNINTDNNNSLINNQNILDKNDNSTSSNTNSNNSFSNLIDGTYEGTGQGRNGDISVSVVVKLGKVSSITIESSKEDEQFFDKAKSTVINEIISEQSIDVQIVSGATMSSNGIIDAVSNALGISYVNPNSTITKNKGHGRMR